MLIDPDSRILIFTAAVGLAPQDQNQFSREMIIRVVALPAVILKSNPAQLTQDTYIEQ
jgi:hypothetical protein